MENFKETRAQISTLLELSYNGLENLYDPDQELFAFYIKDGNKIPMPLSWSICYTAMTILGINKAYANGRIKNLFYDQPKVLSALVNRWGQVKEFGHLGLLHWVNAECNGTYAQDITNEIEKRSEPEYLSSVPTTQLAWLLTGFCATYKTLSTDKQIKALAGLYFQKMLSNFNTKTGLFCHTQKKASPFDFRSLIGNFADQIYGVFALSYYYEVYKDQQALELAMQCANRLCELQGSQGQWYWHYNALRGIVVSRFPVFAVHQDGMGPLGLQKLSEVSGKDFHLPIQKGLDWLFKSNELEVEMVDWKDHVIWRDIERTSPAKMTRYLSMLLAEVNLTQPIHLLNSSYCLKLNQEMRPYELGWLLYGLSNFDIT